MNYLLDEEDDSRWVSVETRLPDKYSVVLVTLAGGDIRLAEHRGQDWWVTVPSGWNLYVIAWRPLPMPYATPAPLPSPALPRGGEE